jgi:hypothetical protein
MNQIELSKLMHIARSNGGCMVLAGGDHAALNIPPERAGLVRLELNLAGYRMRRKGNLVVATKKDGGKNVEQA